MRLIIVPEDKFVSINGKGVHGVDMTWIPEFTGESGISTSVHAVQWYSDHGEIELENRDSNIQITELGVFEQVVTKYEERLEELRLEALRLEELRLEALRLEELRLEELRLEELRLEELRLEELRLEELRLEALRLEALILERKNLVGIQTIN